MYREGKRRNGGGRQDVELEEQDNRNGEQYRNKRRGKTRGAFRV